MVCTEVPLAWGLELEEEVLQGVLQDCDHVTLSP